MSSFENRKALPLVLDEVHRRTVAARLAELGFEVQTGAWSELEELTTAYYDREPNPRDIWLNVVYDGSHTFGPIFSRSHRLLESEETLYALERYGTTRDLGGWAMHRQILIEDSARPTRSSYYRSRILMMPDSPPLAIHGDDYQYVTGGKPYTDSDAELVSMVSEAFGPDAIEFIDEDVAAGVIRALQLDDARIASRA